MKAFYIPNIRNQWIQWEYDGSGQYFFKSVANFLQIDHNYMSKKVLLPWYNFASTTCQILGFILFRFFFKCFHLYSQKYPISFLSLSLIFLNKLLYPSRALLVAKTSGTLKKEWIQSGPPSSQWYSHLF